MTRDLGTLVNNTLSISHSMRPLTAGPTRNMEYVLNPVLSGGGNDESSSESPEGEEKESPDDETQDNPKIAKLTGMSKFYRGTSHKL